MDLFRFLPLITFLLLPSPCRPSGEVPTPAPDQVLIQIQQLIQQGNLPEARTQISKAIQREPRQASLYSLLGVVDAQEKRYHPAEANFRKAISLSPEFQGPYLNLGHLYQENQAADPTAALKAIEVYSRLLKIDPDNQEAHYQLSVLSLGRSDYQGCLEHVHQLPQALQASPQVLAVLCASLGGMGRVSEAERVAQQLLSNNRVNEADITTVLPVLERNRIDSVQIALLEGLASKGLASPGTLHQLGIVYERQGRLEQARSTLEKVAANQTISSSLLLELARIAYKQKDNQGALGYLAHARDLDPKNSAVHFFWGIVCIEEDLPVEALKALREAVSLSPDNAYARYALGDVILKTRDPGEAVVHFQRFCELRPGDPQGRYALGVAYYASGQYDRARLLLEALVNDSITAAGANFYLARLDRQEGNLDSALKRITLALKANDQYADAYSELGQIQMRRRELPLAENAFQKSIQIDPDNYLANLNLLVVYQRTQDPKQEAQAQRFEEVKKKRTEKEQLYLRKIEIRPY
ncbi:MAG TPA: tetratricopeptide repeat protein [Terriglobia bacterium]|nr:tetratricopeptide repeat protein [Terriglobia bacterium]